MISASVALRGGKEKGERGSDAWGLRVRGGASGHALRDGRRSRAKRRGPRGAGEADRAGRGVGLSGREAGRAGRGVCGSWARDWAAGAGVGRAGAGLIWAGFWLGFGLSGFLGFVLGFSFLFLNFFSY